MKTIPELQQGLEGFLHGMNTLEKPNDLIPGMYQLLQNAFPGITIEPRNGINEVMESSAQLGAASNGGSEDTFFRPERAFIQAGGKDFVFVWDQSNITTDHFSLEIWNITDDARTRLVWGYWDETDVHFSMVKLYDAIYITMNYEIENPNSSYLTKNKIIEWDSDAGDWLVREMGIDVAGSFQSLSIEDIAQPAWSERAGHKVVEFKNQLWMLGGTDLTDALNDDGGLFYSIDGNSWIAANPNIQFGGLWGAGFIVFLNKLWIIGGGRYDPGLIYYDEIYSSVDGETWVLETAAPGFSARNNHTVLVYWDRLWVIGGSDVGGSKKDVWNSVDGVTWNEIDNDAEFGTRYLHTSLVYDGKMWVIGGTGPGGGIADDECWWSIYGYDWTAAASGAAAFGERNQHSSVVFQGKMWVIAGNAGALVNDVYSSSDGATWTEETADAGFTARIKHESFVFDNKIWVWGGKDVGGFLNDIYSSPDGATWSSSEGGITPALYYNYAVTFVRRTDASSKLASIDDYVYTIWENYNGVDRVSIDEKLLTGTVSLSTTALTGVDTAFDTELAADDYIRIDGKFKKYKITSVTDALNAVVVNADSDTYTTKGFSLLPTVGDPITINAYHPGVVEGIDDIDQRRCLYMIPPAGSSANGRVFIELPDVVDAVAQGATHLRVYRSLGNEVKAIAQGLALRYNVDISITGDAFYSLKIYPDNTTDNALTGETNYLEMTGYSVPPLGRYCIWAGSVLWIGGIPDEAGKWFHSVVPGTAGVSFDTQFPQKYASMFDLDEDYISCDPSDGQKDTGVAELAGDLYLFKERKIFVSYNANPNNKPVRISSTIGCAFPFSIVNAEIPLLGGHVILFLSESGPAYISTGGQVKLLPEFAIAELYRKNEGIIRNPNGSSTSWYTRNKVTSEFWHNTWWVFFGDADDPLCELAVNKCFGFRFSEDGKGIGPFECFAPFYNAGITDIWSRIVSEADLTSVAMSSEGNYIAYSSDAIPGDEIIVSDNYGRTWTRNNLTYRVYDLAMSSDGEYMYGAGHNGVYVSSDYGVSWSLKLSGRYDAVDTSSDGRIVLIGNVAGTLQVSDDYGATWTAKSDSSNWQGCAMSSDGKYMLAASSTSNQLRVSHDYGDTWTNYGPAVTMRRTGISSDGKYMLATTNSSGDTQKSSDYGVTWTNTGVTTTQGDCVVSSDARIQLITDNSNVYISTDYGETWTLVSTLDINKLAISSDGRLAVGHHDDTVGGGGGVYISTAGVYEPQSLVPVDNNVAYSLSHKDHYGLAQFLKPGLFQDTYLTDGAISYHMVYQTRYLYVSAKRTTKGMIDRVIIHMRFAGTGGWSGPVVTINIDKSKLKAVCDWSQTRQSGMGDTGMADYRDFIHVFAPEKLKILASYFDIKVAKLVPSDGDVTMSGTELIVSDDIEQGAEFSDAFSDPTGSTTFVVEADASPEVDAHA